MIVEKLTRLNLGTRIVVICVVVSVTIVSFAALVSLVGSNYRVKAAMVQRTIVLAKMSADSVASAVAFADQQAAEESLSYLAADSDVVLAEVKDSAGNVFARYTRVNSEHFSQVRPSLEFVEYQASGLPGRKISEVVTLSTDRYLKASAPIIIDGLIGEVSLYSDSNKLHERRLISMALWGIFIALAALITCWVARKLQPAITGPLDNFGQAISDITENADYSRRISMPGRDEICSLAARFDDMLEQIESRDKRLEQLVQQLQAATDAKSRFLANMSHEIRTPMNAIVGITGLLSERSVDSDTQRYYDIMDGAANNLLSIINDILDISKIEAGSFTLAPTSTDIAHLCREITELYQPGASTKGITLTLYLDPQLPNSLLLDDVRFNQVLSNIIGNALKFTSAGKIDVSLSQRDSVSLLCKVFDTGIGIDSDQQASIFGEFTQADNSITRKYGGTGLGLAVSRELVHMMGGEIGVTSKVGLGSTFWFTVRLVPDPSTAADASASTAISLRPSTDMPSPPSMAKQTEARVLIVDDSETNQFVLEQQLVSKYNISVVCASGGVEAIELTNQQRFDLIFMDIQMPGLDGIAAAREIGAQQLARPGHKTPIIACTADVMKGAGAGYLKQGFDDYLAKPIRRSELLRVMQLLQKPNCRIDLSHRQTAE
ncbi:MAG: signal transduction histidine kinase/ActR/RegA family two-component response regulator [Halioglobus sp.]|jgi:signal transduction histidine kinase/ActR/RegA family two-component response regulator